RVVERMKQTNRDLREVTLRRDELLDQDCLEDLRQHQESHGKGEITLGAISPRHAERRTPEPQGDDDSTRERQERRDARERLRKLRAELRCEKQADREEQSADEEKPDLNESRRRTSATAREDRKST